MKPYSPMAFLIEALATYRIWRFLAFDTFPPIRWLRDKFIIRFGDNSSAVEFLKCRFCSGSWIAAAVVISVILWPWMITIWLVPAVMTLVGLLGYVERL